MISPVLNKRRIADTVDWHEIWQIICRRLRTKDDYSIWFFWQALLRVGEDGKIFWPMGSQLYQPNARCSPLPLYTAGFGNERKEEYRLKHAFMVIEGLSKRDLIVAVGRSLDIDRHLGSHIPESSHGSHKRHLFVAS